MHLLEHSPRRTFASDSPMMYWYMFSSSGPLMKKKFNEYEVATALARSVLSVPDVHTTVK